MFRFEEPMWLWLLVFVALVAFYWWWRSSRLSAPQQQWIDHRLLPNLGKPRSIWKLIIASLLFSVALANPQFSNKKQPVEQKGMDVVIALDISASMYANDISPSRMERAKQLVQQFIGELSGNRIGFMVFAGSAYLQSPLTTDYQIFDVLLPAVSPNLAGQQGTSFASVFDLAEALFEKDKEFGRALLVISDGENHDSEALQKADDSDFVTYSIGVGTEIGGQIPLTNGRYKRDANGKVIISKLNPRFLKKLAREGKGQYYDLESLSGNPQQLINSLDRLKKRTIAVQSYTDYSSFYQWFLAAGLLFLLWQFVGNIKEIKLHKV